MKCSLDRLRAFTLIELLIVVAIIAILAAIAVPNFLEAQTRSKVSRSSADMRSIRTALEAYRVDNNAYPETDTGKTDLSQLGVGMIRLTTPVAYITSIPNSPFEEKNMGGAGDKNANKYDIYLYVRAKYLPGLTGENQMAAPLDQYFQTYVSDRRLYLGANQLANAFAVVGGEWMLKSVGPNNVDDRMTLGATEARIYDPTNGTVSAGDIVTFSDTMGLAQQK